MWLRSAKEVHIKDEQKSDGPFRGLLTSSFDGGIHTYT